MAKFGERLRFLRTSRDLSQMELAKSLKISKSSVNMYERCEREPNLVMLEVIADFFNVDLDYLLGKSDEQNKNALLRVGMDKHNIPALHSNTIQIACRNGTYREQILTDEQTADLRAFLDRMQDASGDL